jgi:nicotinate-nucleotide pyrophosphorylase (carboxylating)
VIPDSQVERWLGEDLGHHDVTNDVPGETTGRIVAREDGVAAGLDAATAVFGYLDCEVERPVGPGDRLAAGDVLLRASGPARALLRAERTAVNVAGHAAGVATKTREAVDRARAVADDVAVAGTRKTTPGLRGVEKRAVAAGGGDTHRLDLSHMVLVKDNHVAELGVETAVERFRERASFATQVEVEVEAVADAVRAVEAGADAVLLDNMPATQVSEGVDAVRGADGDAVVEASGGISLETVADYAATGVDVVSMGALTHSAPSLDLSFRLAE